MEGKHRFGACIVGFLSAAKNHLTILIITSLAAVLRLYHLGYKSISIDESIGAFYAMDSLKRVFLLTINDVHPPLFYLTHHFWIRLFGSSEIALRSISVFFGLLSVVALYKLGVLLFDKRVGLLAAFLLAISPWHIWISQNARSNSMLLFMVILSIYSFIRMLQTEQKKWFVWYAIITTISLYTHYFAFMVWFVQITYVLFTSRRQFLENYLKSGIVILAGYMFWLPFMISQFLTKTRPMYKEFSLRFLKDLFDILNPYIAAPNAWAFVIGEFLFLSLFLYGIVLMFRRGEKIAATAPQAGESGNPFQNLPVKAFLLVYSVVLLATGLYASASRLLPLLHATIEQNNPVIYANTVRYYHIDQVHSFRPSFLTASFIAAMLVLVYSRSGWIVEKWSRIVARAGKHSLQSDQKRYSKPSLLIAHIILPLIFAGIISLKSPYLLLRNMVIAIPAYLILISYSIFAAKRKWLQASLVTTAILLSFVSMSHFERWNTKNDWRDAALIAKSYMRPGDVLLLDHLFGKKPLYYYGVKTVKPLRRKNARKFLNSVDGDLWLLVSYKNEWTVRDSLSPDFVEVEDWTLPGTNNKDDLHPIDGSIHLIHYRRKVESLALKNSHNAPDVQSNSLLVPEMHNSQ